MHDEHSATEGGAKQDYRARGLLSVTLIVKMVKLLPVQGKKHSLQCLSRLFSLAQPVISRLNDGRMRARSHAQNSTVSCVFQSRHNIPITWFYFL